MEPIGTITNFYPFLTENTRTIVEAVLNEADGYDDFVSKLVDFAITRNKTDDLLYFTTIHACWSVEPAIFNKLRPRILGDVMVKPWSFSFIYWQGSTGELHQGFRSSIRQALEISPETWVRLHLLLLGADLHNEQHECEKFLDKAKELIESQPELDCFSAEIHIRQGWFDRSEANIKGAMTEFDKAREIGERYNDVIKRLEAQGALASCLKNSDVFQALSLLEDAYQTFKSIGANYLASVEAGNMGLMHTIIGEYDLAVEFYLEADRISEASTQGRLARAFVFTRIYCGIDLPEDAMEWMKNFTDCEDLTPTFLENLPGLGRTFLSLAVARILIQLKRLEGVSQLLDRTHKLVLESGQDRNLMVYNYVNGLFEVAIGNLNTGLQSMADALTEAERMEFQAHVNDILLSLAKTELKHFDRLGSGETESSGPWMIRLGLHAKERNYSGIRMQHALLKAEYQEQIGESEAALLTLQDALTFTDSLGVKTLRDRILKRLDELETSVKA